jgi:hypothetical protein
MFDIDELDDRITNESEAGVPIEEETLAGEVTQDKGEEAPKEDAGDDFAALEFELNEGDTTSKITGKDIMDRFAKLAELEAANAALQAKINTPAPVPVVQQPMATQQSQQLADPVAQVRAQAQDALARFQNGDPDAIPALLDAFGQLTQLQAQQTSTSAFNQQQAEQRFLAAHSDFTEAAQTGKIKTYLAANPQYGPIEGFLAMKLENQAAAHASEVAALKAQIEQAGKTGKQAGEKEALKTAKARGTLRLIGGGTARASSRGNASDAPKTFTSADDLADAMIDQYNRMHQK